MAAEAPPKRGWGQALLVYLERPVLSMLFLGFSAGLPFYLVFSTLSAWLRTAHIEPAPADKQGAMAAAYQIGYRSALMVASAGALIIAGTSGFRVSYLTMTALVGIGIVTTLLVHEPARIVSEATELREHRVLDWL